MMMTPNKKGHNLWHVYVSKKVTSVWMNDEKRHLLFICTTVNDENKKKFEIHSICYAIVYPIVIDL